MPLVTEIQAEVANQINQKRERTEDDLKASYTEEELQNLFKENFDLWHTGVSAHSHTMYCDLAEQTKVVYDKISEPSTPSDDLPDNAGPGDVINNSNS